MEVWKSIRKLAWDPGASLLFSKPWPLSYFLPLICFHPLSLCTTSLLELCHSQDSPPTEQSLCFSFQIPTWERIYRASLRSAADHSSSKLGPEAKEMAVEVGSRWYLHTHPKMLVSSQPLIIQSVYPPAPIYNVHNVTDALLNEPAFSHTTMHIISPFPWGGTHNPFQVMNAEILSQGQGSWHLSSDGVYSRGQNNYSANEYLNENFNHHIDKQKNEVEIISISSSLYTLAANIQVWVGVIH